MKRKLFLIASILSILLTSCTSTYFYSTLQSTNHDVEKVNNGDFLFENDSLWIAHCFKGEDAPIQITIFNKLNVPLYVDWSRSALILNQVAYSYAGSETTLTTTSRSDTYHSPYWGTSTTYTDSDINIRLPESVNVIPPQTMVSRSTLRLAAQFDEIDKNEYTKGKLALTDGTIGQMGRIKYEFDNTPLRFGSYVSVYTQPEKLQSYTTNFYVTHLIKTKASPKLLPSDMAERGDTFYQQKRPNNTGWEIFGVAALTAGAVAIDVMVHKDDHHHHHY